MSKEQTTVPIEIEWELQSPKTIFLKQNIGLAKYGDHEFKVAGSLSGTNIFVTDQGGNCWQLNVADAIEGLAKAIAGDAPEGDTNDEI